MDTTQLKNIILQIIDQIFASRVIPKTHKVKYVEFIRDNGLTDKMIDELTKLFEQEAKDLGKSIQMGEKTIKRLDEAIAEERKKVDQPQAEMLNAFHQRTEADIERAKQRVGQMEQELEHLAESSLKEVEVSEEDAIRAKLGIDKKSD